MKTKVMILEQDGVICPKTSQFETLVNEFLAEGWELVTVGTRDKLAFPYYAVFKMVCVEESKTKEGKLNE